MKVKALPALTDAIRPIKSRQLRMAIDIEPHRLYSDHGEDRKELKAELNYLEAERKTLHRDKLYAKMQKKLDAAIALRRARIALLDSDDDGEAELSPEMEKPTLAGKPIKRIE